MADIAGGLVNWRLVLQTLFGRSLRRSVDLLIRLLGVISGGVMMISRAGASFVLTMAVIAGLIVIHAALVQVLLIAGAWRRIPRRPAILVAKAAILWRGCVMVARPISL